MEELFSFLGMANNYEDRKVARTKIDGGVVSTALVIDSDKPYETAVRHEKYNNGQFIIVELYDDIDEARKGHEKWVATMATEPEFLWDEGQSVCKKMCQMLGDINTVFKREE